MAYIKIENCNKKIKNKVILEDISLSLERNKIYGFIGHNGSGKTVLFKLIAGLIYSNGGSIRIDDKKVSPDRDYPVKVGVMIENISLWPYLSAFENLSVLAKIRNEISDDDIKNALKRVQLDTGKKAFSKFSLGMKQRLVFAQALMEKPDLLILDEPTNALDKDGVELFKKIIKEEVARGATVLIASHSMEGLTVARNYKSCGWGRERCDREGHAVFLRPRIDSAIMGSASTGISTSSTKLKMISTFCLRLPSDLSGAWMMIFLIYSLTIVCVSSVTSTYFFVSAMKASRSSPIACRCSTHSSVASISSFNRSCSAS